MKETVLVTTNKLNEMLLILTYFVGSVNLMLKYKCPCYETT